MQHILDGLIGGWALRQATFAAWREDERGLARGVLFVAVIALAAGLVPLADMALDAINPPSPEAERAEMQAQFDALYGPLALVLPEENMQSLRENTAAALDLQAAVDSLPKPLPAPASDLLLAVGVWLGLSVVALGNWFGYTIWALLISRWLGGSGGIRHIFSTTALAAAPRLFYALTALIGLLLPGGLLAAGLGLLFWLWSVVVYVRAVQVAAGVSLPRALIAALAPALAVMLLVGCLLSCWLWAAMLTLAGAA
jgi:hypothetical protein